MFSQGPNTREYLQLALARVLELQREIEEGTYVAEINNDSNDIGNIKLVPFTPSSIASELLVQISPVETSPMSRRKMMIARSILPLESFE